MSHIFLSAIFAPILSFVSKESHGIGSDDDVLEQNLLLKLPARSCDLAGVVPLLSPGHHAVATAAWRSDMTSPELSCNAIWSPGSISLWQRDSQS
jgi:hypothetical protein